MKCDMCGMSFEEAQARSACGGCSCSGGCGLVRCPYCGFEAPRAPAWLGRLSSWGRRLFRRGAPSVVAPVAEADRPLDQIPPGAAVWRVERLATADAAAVRRLLLIGALPGAELVLEQAFPAHVIRVGHSRFALDQGLAAAIRVTAV